MPRKPRKPTDPQRRSLTNEQAIMVHALIKQHLYELKDGSGLWRWEEGWTPGRVSRQLESRIPGITVNKVRALQYLCGPTQERPDFTPKPKSSEPWARVGAEIGKDINELENAVTAQRTIISGLKARVTKLEADLASHLANGSDLVIADFALGFDKIAQAVLEHNAKISRMEKLLGQLEELRTAPPVTVTNGDGHARLDTQD